jgi:hypothetical protein
MRTNSSNNRKSLTRILFVVYFLLSITISVIQLAGWITGEAGSKNFTD